MASPKNLGTDPTLAPGQTPTMPATPSGTDPTLATPAGTDPTLATPAGTDPTLATPAGTDPTLATPAGTANDSSRALGDNVSRGDALGRFIVLGKLGEGGMGVVFAAHDPDLDRQVAVKLLRAAHSDSHDRKAAEQRLRREAQAMAKLSHENVITVHEVGSFNGQVYVAMEMLTGGTLSQWQQDEARGWREVLDHYIPAGRGLAAAHAANLVHRDFKPDNVLIGRDGRVRVTDFGLVRSAGLIARDAVHEETTTPDELEPSLTLTGSVMGTPLYMAPEQHLGEPADAGADQFSFCVALYEALFGTPPFTGSTYKLLRENVLSGELNDPKDESDVPRWIRPLLARGLQRDPADRYGSMDELLQLLEHNMGGARRRRVKMIAVAAVITGLAAATIYGFNSGGNSTMAAPSAPVTITKTLPAPAVSVKLLTRSSGVYMHPNLTDDGKHLVYTDGKDIFWRAVDSPSRGRDARNLTASFDKNATQPELSPDGKRIAFSADGALYVMTTTGTQLRQIVELGFWPTWSPDNLHLAYATNNVYDIYSQPDFGGELRRVEIATKRSRMLVPASVGARQPDWSPDGKWIVFWGDGIMTVSAEGGPARKTGARSSWHPVWDTNSDGFYAIGSKHGQYEIARFTWDVKTGKSPKHGRRIHFLQYGTGWHFDFTPDKRRWVSAIRASEVRTWVVAFDPKKGAATALPHRFGDPADSLISPAVSPDGKSVVMTSYSRTENFYVVSSDGKRSRKLTEGNYYRRGPHWSSQDSIAYWRGKGLWMIGADGKTDRRISPKGTYRFPHWSAKGNRLAITYEGDDSRNFPCVVKPLQKDWEAQCAPKHTPAKAGWRTGPFSPDGRRVALLSARGVAIWHLASDRISVVSRVGDDIAWIDNRRLVVAHREQLSTLDLRTRILREFTSLAPHQVTTLPSLSFSPDRKRLYVSTRKERVSLFLGDVAPANSASAPQ